jgi:hypothetical protein
MLDGESDAKPITPTRASAPESTGVRYSSAEGRWIIFATVPGSGIAFLDGTIVNVALPAIEEELGVVSPACSGSLTPISSPWEHFCS